MPIYEYKCLAMSHRFEKYETLAEHEKGGLRHCPGCKKKRAVKQLPSMTGTPILKRGIGGFHKPSRE